MNDYGIALRPYGDGRNYKGTPLLDDIVVRDVSMFRAEDMGNGRWWVCCYLKDGESIVFWLTGKKKSIDWVVTEFPRGDFTYEKGSVQP